jgi:mono/diheme cytochrome c family protein
MVRRVRRWFVFGVLLHAATAGAVAARDGRQGADWTIPPEAAGLRSPIEATPDVIQKGASIFESRCRPCHGPEGRGNGPLSDPAHPAADLTAGVKADLAPDGVLFYRVWNGKRPMPAFKTDLTRDDVWRVVAYVKTLKKD